MFLGYMKSKEAGESNIITFIIIKLVFLHLTPLCCQTDITDDSQQTTKPILAAAHRSTSSLL